MSVLALNVLFCCSRSSPDPPLSFIGEISENISGDNVNVEQPSSSGNCNSSEDEAQERCGCHLILTWIAGYLYRISCGGDDVASSVKSKSKLADYSRSDVFQVNLRMRDTRESHHQKVNRRVVNILYVCGRIGMLTRILHRTCSVFVCCVSICMLRVYIVGSSDAVDVCRI